MFKKLRSSAQDPVQSPVPQPYAQYAPAGDLKRPWEELEGDQIVLAGRNALVFIGQGGVQDSGLWHEVQFARWSKDSRKLTVVWIQPERDPIIRVTLTDNPKRLMEAITSRVNKTIVATRSFYTADGVRVAASIRRRVDGQLFSTLIVTGDLNEDDRIKAERIEQTLREELGVED